jgi:TRAP-type C4-dicarboxylate transport system substrate-binding protein
MYLRHLLAGAAMVVAASAQADELKFASFTPPFHTINASVIEKLNADLSAATGGALTVKGYHGGELGAGPAPCRAWLTWSGGCPGIPRRSSPRR